jgi:phospholipid N-methyltransferase
MKYESYESSNGWYSHRLYLFKELISLNDGVSILEFGVGDGSSILIHDYCKENKNAQAIAFETDKNWFLKIKDQYELENYKFILLENWSNLQQYLENKTYDLVFIDQSPWEARIESIDFLKNQCKTIMLHDYDFYQVNDKDFFEKYREAFDLHFLNEKLPPTLIMRSKNEFK